MDAHWFRVALLSIALATNFVVAADVDVTEWLLRTSVVDGSASPTQRDLEFSLDPQNPFLSAQSVSLGPTDWAVGEYDISWLNNTGSFHLGVEQHVHGVSRSASSGGQFYFTTAIDLIFNAAGNLTFASSPGDEADFAVGLSITSAFPLVTYYSGFDEGGDSNFQTPASGEASFASGDLLLPAGNTYRVNINLASRTSSKPNQDPISALGEVNFSWRPVPEPATLLFVLPMAAGLLRRRR